MSLTNARECSVCEVKFSISGRNHKYCSVSCYDKASARIKQLRAEERKTPKFCVSCKEVKLDSRKRDFCDPCRALIAKEKNTKRAKIRRDRNRTFEERSCLKCQQSFQARSTSRRLYCSTSHAAQREVDLECESCGMLFRGRPRRVNCDLCVKKGYKDSKPGTFYILEHETDLTFKGGITNEGTRRLKTFESAGFKAVFTFTSPDGGLMRVVEGRFHAECRRLNLPQYYTAETMPGGIGGHTETYSMLGLTIGDVTSIATTILRSV